MNAGKKKRLRRIFREDRKTVIVPMDHGTTIGPVEGIVEMQKTVDVLLKGKPDAFVLHKGIAKNVDTRNAGLIVHLSGSTKLGPDPDNKILVCSVEEAARIGADAVSVHINIGARREDKMLHILGKVADDCEKFGLPLLAMMYPRGPKIKDQYNVEVVSHVARLGVELGADVIKTNYTGNTETFKEVIRSCGVPVVIAGGPKVNSAKEIFEIVINSVSAGGAGISIGRNIFQHDSPDLMALALSAIVHGNVSIKESLEILGGSK
ncbi:MAG: 2-amino-3,7-dideoxy-D-threo-hept-6-ulosonate synthase [Candidatus Bathyarchaeota archaeon]|nr:2-amino-3,7-dideoxy-D-threo-hept-6-ulosonate synthase [Candidatus Bathyarchaeota archaeon]